MNQYNYALVINNAMCTVIPLCPPRFSLSHCPAILLSSLPREPPHLCLPPRFHSCLHFASPSITWHLGCHLRAGHHFWQQIRWPPPLCSSAVAVVIRPVRHHHCCSAVPSCRGASNGFCCAAGTYGVPGGASANGRCRVKGKRCCLSCLLPCHRGRLFFLHGPPSSPFEISVIC